ncbi:DUF3857 domain-containing protein [Alteromonas pelagimontana]|uniref:DUF3857 domain-containing protein n=1 Tax=Alteromonas pelagimontana TaxID=1858656 RepID=A0A6M4MH41_9ALTE|nr:DUF3857 domain-containing protein [Alteromonas pelagimontana]QJR82238.1 DUF3857 domain-containing protein [Alteromonas pelagimontana]
MTKILVTFLLVLSAAPALAITKDPALAEEATAALSSIDKSAFTTLTALLEDVKVQAHQDEIVTKVTRIWYYPTKTSVQDSGYESVPFSSNDETLTILAAGSISPAGDVRWVDEAGLKIIDDDSYNTFTDGKRMVVSYPAVSVGGMSVISYEIRHPVTEKTPFWSFHSYPQRKAQVVNYRFLASWTEQQPLHAASDSDNVQCEQKEYIFSCKGENIDPVKADKSISVGDDVGKISVSSLSNWQAVQKIVNSGFDVAISNSAGIAEKVTELTSNLTSQRAKIGAIHEFVSRDVQFVSRDVRYVSMSEQGHAIVPHKADETLRNRYGDCKDKTALLLAMLAEIDIDAEPVLVATERSRPASVLLPSVTLFDHVVACFDWEDSRYCLDPTDAYTSWQNVPDWIQNRVSLPLESEAQLQNLLADSYRWRLHSQTTIRFNPSGGQTEKQRVSFEGAYESQVRGILARQNEKERNEWAVELYHDTVADSADPAISFSGVETVNQELFIETLTEFPSYFDPDDGINLDENDAWLAHELSTAKIQNKVYDVFYAGSRVVSEYQFVFPEDWEIIRLPAELNLQHPLGSFTRTVSRRFNGQHELVLTVKSKLLIHSRWLEKNNFAQFNALVDVFQSQTHIVFAGQKG